MKTHKTIQDIRAWLKEQRLQGKSIGLVPTMGYLHQGHLSLVHAARQENDRVIMSIFVNPLQFAPNEDYNSYPRDIERDSQLAEEAGVDVLFAPDTPEIYPYYPQDTTIQVKGVSEGLCGACRPGHFTGVATVVAKLFNIIQPDKAYFGQKDYQQVQVIRQMTRDLNLPVDIKTVPIVREADGLALSSRNVYLSQEERKEAPGIYESLQICRKLFARGETKAARLKSAVKERLDLMPSAVIDYIEIRDADTLALIEEVNVAAVVAVAVRVGRTRLIDNTIIGGSEGCTGQS